MGFTLSRYKDPKYGGEEARGDNGSWPWYNARSRLLPRAPAGASASSLTETHYRDLPFMLSRSDRKEKGKKKISVYQGFRKNIFDFHLNPPNDTIIT